MPKDRIIQEEKMPKPDKNSTVKEQQDSITVKEPAPVLVLKNKPFALFTTNELKAELLSQNSNFNKIVAALNISNVSNHLITDIEDINSLSQYKCVWCIGLPPKKQQDVNTLEHSNILHSPNPEILINKEEKTNMYNPLKQFIDTNSGVFSRL